MTPETSVAITLRPAVAEDREFLLSLYGSTRANELAMTSWSDAEKRAFIEMQFDAQTRAYAAYKNALQSIVDANGTAVGRLYVDRRPDEIRIVDITIAAGRRNRGIGTKLLCDLISEAEHQQKPLTIHVERFNPALRLYTRLGFQVAADKGAYLLMKWGANAL